MASRSLQLRPECRDVAKTALRKLGWIQVRLGMEAQIQSPATLSNFFRGKPVDRGNFKKLCELLSLDPEQVGQEPPKSQPLDDPNPYISRSSEEFWCSQLLEPHSLIRIQAPLQFGKTILMRKMLNRAEKAGHLTRYITLNGIDARSFRDPQTFFRRFICELADELEELNGESLMPLERYDELVDLFDYTKATIKYFEYFLEKLEKIDKPFSFTLAINKLDRLLDDLRYAKTASEFLHLLRFMNEKTKAKRTWEQFRLILAYSALRFEDSISLIESQSPFNVGYSIDLGEFSPNEVEKLAAIKGLTLHERQIQSFMQSIGGIPSLVQLTLNSLCERGALLLQDPAAIRAIYQQHLMTLEDYLRRVDLYLLMSRIATTSIEITELDTKARNSLYRYGLIIPIDRQFVPRCELYRGYFSQH